MQRVSDYKINRTSFRVGYGNITDVIADAVVSSDDNYLTMSGGVSRSLLIAAGDTIQQEVRKQVPMKAGQVAVTSAGNLSAKFIFHAVTIDFDNLISPNEDIICSATGRCLQLADALNIRSIVFPALGTGAGGFPFQLAADCMTRTISEYLVRETGIETISLALLAREMVQESDLNTFYERAVALSAISSQSKKLSIVLSELQKLMSVMNRPDLVIRVRELQKDLEQAQFVLSETPETIEQVENIQERSNIAQISRDIVAVSVQAQEVSSWNDLQLEADIQRTKLQGLLTRLNVQQSQLNKLEIKRAKYGLLSVPVHLETEIEDLILEMGQVEEKVKQVRKYLVSLNAQ